MNLANLSRKNLRVSCQNNKSEGINSHLTNQAVLKDCEEDYSDDTASKQSNHDKKELFDSNDTDTNSGCKCDNTSA